MIGNGKHLGSNEMQGLGVKEHTGVAKLVDYARNFIEVQSVPKDEQGFIYDLFHPAFQENEKYKDMVFEGTTFYYLYNDNFLIEVVKVVDPKTKREFEVSYGYIKYKTGSTEKEIKQKLKVEGDFIEITYVGVTEEEKLQIPKAEYIDDPNYVPGQSVNSNDFSTICVNQCCRFRLYGNPFNPLVEYEHCGSNCGRGLDHGGGTPVNALDRCCATHDACWANFGDWDCDCDRNLIACADGTDNAGSSRVANAFRAVVLWNC